MTSVLKPGPSAPWWHREFYRSVGQVPADVIGAAHAMSAHASAMARTLETRQNVDRVIGDLAFGVSTIDEWRTRLFVDAGFTGNGADYHDPRNSALPDVLHRKLGIPISLALVGRLVAERAGLSAWGIGLPGHFLLGVAPPHVPLGAWWHEEARVVDPFSGGRSMSPGDVEVLFSTMFGRDHSFDLSMLRAISDDAMFVRMLANLKANYARGRSLGGLTAVVRLRTCLPDWSLDEGRELVRLLALGCILDEATEVLDALDACFPAASDILAAERARLARSLN